MVYTLHRKVSDGFLYMGKLYGEHTSSPKNSNIGLKFGKDIAHDTQVGIENGLNRSKDIHSYDTKLTEITLVF